ncbi:MAG: DNA topoisomerase I [Flavobacteriales bacterium]|nr:DNA topoisomerase I [Flavobacteriales bacterium]|tara:strand:+ start:8289 stop:10565 length:2277 start_codon:yes stop_codon:yes gene_type:complete
MSNLVIVESPAKASTIEKILGKDFKVVSSYGHIRDLEKKNMGIDLKGSFEPQYCVSADKKKILHSLIKESKKSNTIWLATDEDREGEAIAWHLFETLELHDKNVNRIVFHEITASAITKAVANPRDIDINLVNAQQARRILDRIVGFKISPILWKKVKSGLSAGRVQSVAVRLIVEREKKISVFKPIKSFQITADFLVKNSESFNAIMLNDVSEKNTAKSLLESFVNTKFIVDSIDTKPSFSAPSSPFTTSSLQQVASSRLGFSVSRTMSVAQKLYESGHITYMRTDSTNLSKDSMSAIESYVISNYGANYFKARKYSTKTKVAQEAHEAIRPTQFNNLICGKDDAQKKLYRLIWERTICSQMSNAVIDKTIMNINVANKENSIFQAKGQIIKFDGYLKVQKQFASSQKDKLLPSLKEGDSLDFKSIIAKEKYSKPPSRFTEASLVKKLEELGIGRPSTYAPTISTIQKREYVVKDDVEGREIDHAHLILEQNSVIEKTVVDLIGSEKKKLSPTEIGKLTTEFLVEHFKDILEYNFTAKIESQFDDVAMGKKEWKNLIKTFYAQFEPTVLNADQNSEKITGQRELGVDPNTGKNIYVRLGKYGPIVQMGDIIEGGDKPKYAKLRKGQSIDLINLDMALELFKLPRTIGAIDNKDIIVSEGKYGPYVRYDNNFVSLGDLDPMTVTLEECVKLIEKKREFDKQKIINSFNSDDAIIQVCNGKYGPYIKYNKKNYKIPKETDPHKLTKDDCLNLIQKSSKK